MLVSKKSLGIGLDEIFWSRHSVMAASANPHLGRSPLTVEYVSEEKKTLIKNDANYVEENSVVETNKKCKVM